MHLILVVAIIITSCAIFREDFRSRRVHVFLFMLLAILGCSFNLTTQAWEDVIKSSVINAGFVMLQGGVMFLYFRYVHKNKVGFRSLAGPGDIAFLGASCLVFHPGYFFLYYVFSLIFSLALHYLFFRNKRYQATGNTVALAGWQALFLAIFLPVSLFISYL